MPIEPQSMAYESQAGVGTLSLSGVVDIFEATRLHELTLAAFEDTEATALNIDLTHAERLDLTAIQLLFALHRDVTAMGRSCTFGVVPERITTLFNSLGVTYANSPN